MIKMDINGYEVYDSIESFMSGIKDRIHNEDVVIDTQLEFLGLENAYNVYSDEYSAEAILDTVKEMSSKARSNFVLYAKKFINFAFGWLIEFIRGTYDMKKYLAGAYNKVTKYKTSLDKLETKASNNQTKISITMYGNRVIASMVMIQMFVQILERAKTLLDEGSIKNENNNGFINLSVIMASFQAITQAYSVIDLTNMNTIIESLSNSKYNIGAIIDLNPLVKELSGIKSEADLNELIGKLGNNQNMSKDMFKRKSEAMLNSLKNDNSRDVTVGRAYQEIQTQLTTFIEVSNNNQWDFKNVLKFIESVRRDTISMLEGKRTEARMAEGSDKNKDMDKTPKNTSTNTDKPKPKNNKEDLKSKLDDGKESSIIWNEFESISMEASKEENMIAEALKKLISIGNNLALMKSSTITLIKVMDKSISGMTADAAKLGNMLIKVGE